MLNTSIKVRVTVLSSAISVLLWWHKVKQHSLVDKGRNARGVRCRDGCQMSWMWSLSQAASLWLWCCLRKGQRRWREIRCLNQSEYDRSTAWLLFSVELQYSLAWLCWIPPFKTTKKIQVKQDCCRNYYAIYQGCGAWGGEGGLWGKKGYSILITLMKSISYQNNNGILF